MTKKELSQLYYLKKEIKWQIQKIKELENQATSCGSNMTGMPHSTDISDKTGNLAAQIADLKNVLAANLKKRLIEICRLNSYIESIEDSKIRLILTLRYVQGLSWKKIAFEIGESDEQYPRRKHNGFLKKSKLDENDELPVLKW